MARDDFEIIAYKILLYLYECMKTGHEVKLDQIAWLCPLFEVERSYWIEIMKDLVNCEYVSGLRYIEAKDMEGIMQTGIIRITPKGREYLRENSGMKRAADYLGEAFKILVGGIIGRL